MAGTGFVSINDYLNANQGTLDRERGDLQTYLDKEFSDAQGASDNLIKSAVPGMDYTSMPGLQGVKDKITKAQQDQTGLGTYGGVSDLLQRIYGGTQDQANFDAGLLGPQQSDRPNLDEGLKGGLSVATIPLQPPGVPGSSEARHNRPGGRGVYPAPPPPPEQPSAPPEEWWEGKDFNNYGGGGG